MKVLLFMLLSGLVIVGATCFAISVSSFTVPHQESIAKLIQTPTPTSEASSIIINIPYQPITDILEATEEDDGVSPPSEETASASII